MIRFNVKRKKKGKKVPECDNNVGFILQNETKTKEKKK